MDPVRILETLISYPSVSRNEDAVADRLTEILLDSGIDAHRVNNNIWALASDYDTNKPTIMLNSHIDTVKPSSAYTIDPFTPLRRDGKIYGLGSNDAGASVVSLITVFDQMRHCDLPYNLLLAISAEEEVSGEKGMRSLLPALKDQGINIDMAIVGEPTGMQPAVAERGLVVLDGVALGRAGHAARNEGINALYIALDDIQTLRNYRFDHVSQALGDIKITVTQIQAGMQHNVVPAECKFVVDIRTTDAYTNQQTVAILQKLVKSTLTPRSTHIHASVIDYNHILVKAAVAQGAEPYVSPTTSDRALMPGIPALKIGPGDSARSHTADEFIYEAEIIDAIDKYKKILDYCAAAL